LSTPTKAVLITGAGARVGQALARGLADEGWAVAIHYNRSEKGAQSLKDYIEGNGGRAAMVQANLNVPSDVNTLVGRAVDALGVPLTALINNASTFEADSAEEMTDAVFDHHMDVNLRAPLKLARDFAAQCQDNHTGAIINIIDQRVLKPNPLFFTYSISKSAIHWATQTLAQSLAPNIRVNAVGPGPTLRNTVQSPEEFKEEASSTLLGHGSPPDQLLEAVRYLLSAKSVTGQMIAVDSGQHLTWQTPDLMIGTDDDT